MKRLLIFTCLFDIDANVVFDRRFVFSKATDVTHPEKRPGQRSITTLGAVLSHSTVASSFDLHQIDMQVRVHNRREFQLNCSFGKRTGGMAGKCLFITFRFATKENSKYCVCPLFSGSRLQVCVRCGVSVCERVVCTNGGVQQQSQSDSNITCSR